MDLLQGIGGRVVRTDRVAAFDWTFSQVKEAHLELNRQMNALLEALDSSPETRRVAATA